MHTFLELVAQDLYSKIGKDLSQVAVIFPNKRASLFFNEYLTDQSTSPIWAPTYLSISELFQQLSPLKIGDPIQLVCELHKVFCEETQKDESLDDFYFWGELLISDFDDVDKNLVDANQLFANLKDLKEIVKDLDYLDKEQEQAIQQFFKAFSIDKSTELKDRFISLWDCLNSIYHQFQSNLESSGVAYEGMLYRKVIEELKNKELPYETFIFVGFNVLNEVEKQFFQLLQNKEKALFYWDYDVFYTQLNTQYEAGEFILRNLKLFPNELKAEHFDRLNKPKQIKYIAASTENEQARYLPLWIDENLTNKERESAIVLCNESLLLPVLHSIPQQVKNLNVTMGFPLSQTPVYSFILSIIELQSEGYNSKSGRYLYKQVVSVLNHPYTQKKSDFSNQIIQELTIHNRFYPTPAELQKDDFMKILFTPIQTQKELCKQLTSLIKQVAALYNTKEESTSNVFNPLYKESLFKGYTLINRLYTLIESGHLEVEIQTLTKLIERLLISTQIPFHGEPAIGLQIMGVLETRNLDFKNIVMLSVNEGQLPKKGNETSFIPYNLRKAFGMTTLEHKNAVYAYYFYRLLQRAENITLIYNNTRSDQNEGEWSRFMLQLLIGRSQQDIQQFFLNSQQKPQLTTSITIPKNDETLAKLIDKYNVAQQRKGKSILSPSAINTYLDCRLKFYYRYIVNLTPPTEVSSEIDPALFGSIFHKSAELTYQYLTSHTKRITKEEIERLLNEKHKLKQFVDDAFKGLLFHIDQKEKSEYNGTQLINFEVIKSYLEQLLRYDMNQTPFDLIETEEVVNGTIEVQSAKGKIKLGINGIIDRMDKKNGVLRIIDYKTGKGDKLLKELDFLFDREEKNRPNHILQTFIYASILCNQRTDKIAPAILYLRETTRNESPIISIGQKKNEAVEIVDFSKYKKEFDCKMQEVLEEIFDNHTAFDQTPIVDKCTYCDYKQLCQR